MGTYDDRLSATTGREVVEFSACGNEWYNLLYMDEE
jgi:hypothetical protein